MGVTTYTDVSALNTESWANGNLNFDMVDGANTYFINEANDFHLQAGGSGLFLTVKTGGLESFGSFGAPFEYDLLGLARTTGWSLGAYEQDD